MQPHNILLVEDTELARKLAERMLISLGYDVTVASNADEALRMLHAGRRFDMLFTDILMPGSMNGIELARVARNIDKHMHVLFTSGYSPMQPEELFELKATYVTKPYRKIEIAAILENVLNGS